jgi:hypothetical protein
MRKFIGALLILAGIALGLYVGGYLLFIGGIVQAFTALTVAPISAMGLAVGVFKVACAAFVGWLIFWVCTIISGAFLAS